MSTTRTAILLAAYGSRHPGARASFEHFERRVAGLFPDATVRWCFTSRSVRRLHEADSPVEALERLRSEGFDSVCVQSLHIIPGAEYEEMLAAAGQAADSFTRLATGGPLLSDALDTARVARALLRLLPHEPGGSTGHLASQAGGQHTCAVFLGHGTSHAGNARYEALARALAALDKRALLGTLERGPDATAVRDDLLARGCKEAFLVPFFFAAGVHVKKDMLGQAPDSWASVLRQAGITARPIVQCAGECDGLVDIWMDHLTEAMATLGL